MNFADQEDLARRQRQRKSQKRWNLFWNFMTVLALLGILALIGYFLLIFLNPHLSINPFPPPTQQVTVLVVSQSATPIPPPTAFTPEPTIAASATATFTLMPTLAPTATATQRVFTPDANAQYPFAVEGRPVTLASTTFRADSGCAWQGVAGRVVDLQGRPVAGYYVTLFGSFGDEEIDVTTLTGGAQAIYGEGGYEFYLGSQPLDSAGELRLQLLDANRVPVSAVIVVDTFAACDKNLVLVNFKQVR